MAVDSWDYLLEDLEGQMVSKGRLCGRQMSVDGKTWQKMEGNGRQMEVRWQEMEDRCQEIAGRWKQMVQRWQRDEKEDEKREIERNVKRWQKMWEGKKPPASLGKGKGFYTSEWRLTTW